MLFKSFKKGNIAMKYISTRGLKQSLTSAEAIIAGIANDGGLFVPTEIPQIDADFIDSLINLSYQDRAKKILEKFLVDYNEIELTNCVNNAYGFNKFDDSKVAPVVSAGDNHILELWHGPTSAFKDMALQLLPQLMATALKKTGEKSQIVILVATSGDTGKAALEGFKDVEQIKILVFYPDNGVSQIQRLQMITQEGSNVKVIAVDGNFDDAQTGVKKIFNNEDFNANLKNNNIQLSSANSINWGRLVPQIVYYFSAYADLLQSGKISVGTKVNFVVPTGNFGNILAGYYAKLMGLPIHKLICASNANNVLTDFLNTGIYDRNRPFYKTSSPSMDILISSNLERLLYALTNADDSKINKWMKELNDEGQYKVDAEVLTSIKENFWSDFADDVNTAETIKTVFEEKGYTLDPHTAVAWYVADKYKKTTKDELPLVIVSTASPYKFNENVLGALDSDIAATLTDEFAVLDKLAEITKVKVPEGLASLRTAKVIHTDKCQKEEMAKFITKI